MTLVRIQPPHPFKGGFLTRRILILLLVASFCFASFTFGVSAASSDYSVSATYNRNSSEPGSFSITDSSPYSTPTSSICQSLSITVPSAGTLIFSLSLCHSTFTLSGLTYSQSGESQSFTFVASEGGTFSVNRGGGSYVGGGTFKITISSWTPAVDPDPPAPSPDNPGGSYITNDDGGWNGWNSDGSYTPKPGGSLEGMPSHWNIYNQYIGQLEYMISDGEATFSDKVWISKMLSNLAFNGWAWRWNSEINDFQFVTPPGSDGSWLDNMFRMNVYLYYNLRNQKGWFGHINSEFDTLNTRVLQILSVLANDEDVKIKDATTDHRNWITNFFEGSNTGKPTVSDNDAVNDSMNTVKDQFQSSYTVGDIGSIFSGNSYDNNIWYTFWSQPVFNDVNGIDRGGFGGGKAYARAPASSKPSWSSQYSYDDDSIPDMSGFGGGLSD